MKACDSHSRQRIKAILPQLQAQTFSQRPIPVSMNSWLVLLFLAGLLYVFRRLLAFWKVHRSIQCIPGRYVFLSQQSPLTYFLPRIHGISWGRNHIFDDKHATFEHGGWDASSAITIHPEIRVSIALADAAAIKEVTSSRARFPKPVEMYSVLAFFGPNIVASEGEEWKKYRKICAPAFSDRNNKLVWNESIQIVEGLFKNVWKDADVISVDHCGDITWPLALFVISIAGFGRQISWTEDTIIPSGHLMTFKDAIHLVAGGTFTKAALPNWALGLTHKTRTVKLAFEELHKYMSEMIQERQSSEKLDRHDLFTNLLEANDDGSDTTNLTESELIGNIYIFLLAGHETAAQTLCFTFALLALYEEEQEKLFQNIKSALPDGRDPMYEEMSLFTYSMAVFYETLRMFPPAVNFIKTSAEDTGLVVGNIHDERLVVPVPKGTTISVNVTALHYNPRYWEDPHSFKPARFLGDWPRDAFLPFSSGARACVGRKFFETEGIAVLTKIISQYKITIKEETQFTNETFEERRSRVLSASLGLTLSPHRVPLVFTRRI
ncbi:cytochrome P450 [Crassisporium funariophilum]|nr:cytochrome P450 [Crassisporium funariophilum]